VRLLVIPALTKLAAASPFHGHFVSPGSKRTFLLALRTMLTTGVSPMCEVRTVTAVTPPCLFFPHLHDRCIGTPFARHFLPHFDHSPLHPRIDKTGLPPENRRFSSLQWKAFLCQLS
jgi:hypothetical protein